MGSSAKTIEWYKTRAKVIHGNKYDYHEWHSFVKYHNKIPVTCTLHGVFHVSLANHITRASGCPECRAQKRRTGFNKKTIKEWTDRAQATHNNTYTYQFPQDFSNADTDKITITCLEHGEFKQTVADHVRKRAKCPRCAVKARLKSSLRVHGTSHPSQSHISQAVLEKLNNKDWLATEHVVNQRTLEDIARELGVQDTTVGRYCKRLNIDVVRFPVSAGERELQETVMAMFGTTDDVCINTRSVIPPLELDVYVPRHNLAIEYCGLYWHGDKHKKPYYHMNKHQRCAANGIRLLTVYEDEWLNRRGAVVNAIRHLCNKSPLPSIPARKCLVRLVNSATKKQFFEQHHIQGDGPSSINIGLYMGADLVACMGVISQQHHKFVINRYATNAIVQGGFTKLLAYIKRNYAWSTITTFADMRWSEGHLYEVCGFRRVYDIAPDYYWTNGTARWHKFGFRHKHLPNKLNNYDPHKTEDANCRANGLWKIYDCGKIKFSMENTE